MSELLKEATATLNELIRMNDLNQELLETLTVTMLWLKDYAEKHNISIPRERTYLSLIRKAETLINDICSKETTFAPRSRKLPFKKFDDRKPEELPEWKSVNLISLVSILL